LLATEPAISLKQEPADPSSSFLEHSPIKSGDDPLKIEEGLLPPPPSAGPQPAYVGDGVDSAACISQADAESELELKAEPAEQVGSDPSMPEGEVVQMVDEGEDIVIKTDDDNTLLNQLDETGLPKVIIFSWIRYPLLVPVYPAQRNQMCTRLRL
jgi:hypothetical protein